MIVQTMEHSYINIPNLLTPVLVNIPGPIPDGFMGLLLPNMHFPNLDIVPGMFFPSDTTAFVIHVLPLYRYISRQRLL